jgi:hypothetical protein
MEWIPSVEWVSIRLSGLRGKGSGEGKRGEGKGSIGCTRHGAWSFGMKGARGK